MKKTQSGVSKPMVKGLSKYLTPVALTALVLAAPGCGTPPRIGSRPPSFGEEQGRPTPFLDRADYSDRLGLVMRDVLASHRFSIPWIVVGGSDRSLWFVAANPESVMRTCYCLAAEPRLGNFFPIFAFIASFCLFFNNVFP